MSALSEIVEGKPSFDILNNKSYVNQERLTKFNSNKESELYESSGLNEEFYFNYKNAIFNNGFVSVLFKPGLCLEKEEIKVLNNKILCEYHYIRSYFPKYFKKGKKFKVHLSGEVKLGKLINYVATSGEIQSINENLISEVKKLFEVDIFDTIDLKKITQNILALRNC